MGIRAVKLARSPHQPTGTWIWPATRLAIYLRDGFRCLLCRRDLSELEPWEVTLDHIVPMSHGGTHEASNLYACCRGCNSSRKDRRLEGAVLRAARARARRSLLRHQVVARSLAAGAAWESAFRAAGLVARAYRTGSR